MDTRRVSTYFPFFFLSFARTVFSIICHPSVESTLFIPRINPVRFAETEIGFHRFGWSAAFLSLDREQLDTNEPINERAGGERGGEGASLTSGKWKGAKC